MVEAAIHIVSFLVCAWAALWLFVILGSLIPLPQARIKTGPSDRTELKRRAEGTTIATALWLEANTPAHAKKTNWYQLQRKREAFDAPAAK